MTEKSGISATHSPRLNGADCFVLALNRMMRRTGQQELIGQTHIILESLPDLVSLRAAADQLAKNFPVLDAKALRNPFNLLASWKWKESSRGLPIRLWRESGSTSNSSEDFLEISNFQDLSESIMTEDLSMNGGLRNLRLDLVHLREGKWVFIMTWSHLLLDGRGAEMLLGALIEGKSIPGNGFQNTIPQKKLWPRIQSVRPILEHFSRLSDYCHQSLGGSRARLGRFRYKLLHLDENQSSQVQTRATEYATSLTINSFYLAIAARAHRSAFQSRGKDPQHYLLSIPVQMRRRGAKAPIFQNCISMLFYHFKNKDLDTIEIATRVSQEQFEKMARKGLDRSFLDLLELMRRIPSAPYMSFVSKQFSGEITSFFHSFTGDFCIPSSSFFGADVLNAYHIPSVFSPPGSGIFIGTFQGKVSVTLSWRDRAVSEEEAELIMNKIHLDLIG